MSPKSATRAWRSELALDAPDIIFVRVNAADKMRIVEALKSRAHIVAVTGHGVNDAPALKTAHVGGLTGTDVVKELADQDRFPERVLVEGAPPRLQRRSRSSRSRVSSPEAKFESEGRATSKTLAATVVVSSDGEAGLPPNEPSGRSIFSYTGY